MAGLSVVIPALEEASQLPLLLADLHRWPGAMEIVVIDAASRDRPSGLRNSAEPACCTQTNAAGVTTTAGCGAQPRDWLLMLHADCRLSTIWMDRVLAVIAQAGSAAADQAWTFDFRVDERRPMLILLEGLWRFECLAAAALRRPRPADPSQPLQPGGRVPGAAIDGGS